MKTFLRICCVVFFPVTMSWAVARRSIAELREPTEILLRVPRVVRVGGEISMLVSLVAAWAAGIWFLCWSEPLWLGQLVRPLPGDTWPLILLAWVSVAVTFNLLWVMVSCGVSILGSVICSWIGNWMESRAQAAADERRGQEGQLSEEQKARILSSWTRL